LEQGEKVEDVNRTLTQRFVKEIRVKGWTKERYNKAMNKSARWITRMESEKREWTVNNFLASCRVLGIAPSSVLKFEIKSKDLCDLSIKEVLQIMLKENCNNFIEENPDKISMIMDFIKVMTKKVQTKI